MDICLYLLFVFGMLERAEGRREHKLFVVGFGEAVKDLFTFRVAAEIVGVRDVSVGITTDVHGGCSFEEVDGREGRHLLLAGRVEGRDESGEGWADEALESVCGRLDHRAHISVL